MVTAGTDYRAWRIAESVASDKEMNSMINYSSTVLGAAPRAIGAVANATGFALDLYEGDGVGGGIAATEYTLKPATSKADASRALLEGVSAFYGAYDSIDRFVENNQ